MTAVASRTGMRGVPGRAGAGLLWTEYWFLLAVAVAAVVTVDPLELRLAADTIVKHLALAVALPAIVLTFVGFGLSAAGHGSAGPALLGRVLWPLLLLATLVLCGSLHARFVQGIQETFLNVGLYLLLTCGAAAMVLRSDAPEALLRAYFRILVAAAAVMGAYLRCGWSPGDFYDYAHGRHPDSSPDPGAQEQEVRELFVPLWGNRIERVRRGIGSLFAVASSRGYWRAGAGGRIPRAALRRALGIRSS